MKVVKHLDSEILCSDFHVWTTTLQISNILDVTVRTIERHIQNLEALSQFKEGTHVITLPVTRQEGEREVTREIRHYSELAVMRIGFRVNSEKALAFQEWAAETLLRLKRDGVVYDDNDATKRLGLLLDELGVPRFAMGGLLARVSHLGGLATAARKRKMGTSTALSQTPCEDLNIIALAHAHLDQIGAPVFAQPNEAERLACRLTCLAALAKGQLSQAKALLMEPAPNYELIASNVLRILRDALNDGLATLDDNRVQDTSTRIIVPGAPVIGFFCSGYKHNGVALVPDKAYRLISRCLAHESQHIPHPNTIWRALMKTDKLASLGTEKARHPWLVRIRHQQQYIRVVLLRNFL